MTRLVVALTLVAGLAPAAALEVDGVTLFDDTDKMPATVLAQVTCDAEPGPHGTRRPFAGGFVFTARCPGNHANQIQALVFAPHADGSGARLIRFPRPQAGPAEELSNVRFDAKRRELGELFVDPESRVCRSEGRWRLTGATAELVFWRQTRDCAGKRGWRVLVDRRAR